jgi:hypothetical protein
MLLKTLSNPFSWGRDWTGTGNPSSDVLSLQEALSLTTGQPASGGRSSVAQKPGS